MGKLQRLQACDVKHFYDRNMIDHYIIFLMVKLISLLYQ